MPIVEGCEAAFASKCHWTNDLPTAAT